MQCDICSRIGGQRLPFLCPTDAQNALYEPRLENARVLIEKDGLSKHISAIVAHRAGAESKEIQQDVGQVKLETVWKIKQNDVERRLSMDRTRQIIARADELRTKVEVGRLDISRRQAVITRRKSELASAVNGTETRRTRQIEDTEKGISRIRLKWDQMHLTMAQSRAFLCGEAAKLYGLRRLSEHGVPLDEYSIGGVSIINLRNMNSASAAQITTSFSHIAHLLVLASHYLALRLPAEITLPHRDYPLPTILSIPSSHLYSNIPFPGSTAQHSSNSGTASRHAEDSNLPRPRPLFIAKPLPLLAKEDPIAYSLFVEGAVLLAYNIAWVCKTQGITLGASGSTSFEDTCAIGRNLFNLLIGTTPRPSPGSRVPSNASMPVATVKTTPTKLKPNPDAVPDAAESGAEDGKKSIKEPALFMGHFSHGTAHTFLGSTEGGELMRGFKLLSPVKLADRLKTQLLSEISNAEWEVLDPDSWAADGVKEFEEDGVMVGASRDERPRRRLTGGLGFGGAMQSFMSMRTVIDAVEIVGGGEKKPGTSGWTKLKPR